MNSARRNAKAPWILEATGVCAALLLAPLLGGCGKQAFVVTESSSQAAGPGFYTIPPKVDILLAEDDTGSIFEIFNDIETQTKSFLQGLENSGWDFHFATTPLTTQRTMDQVIGSRHDENWGSEWVPPFPGAQLGQPGQISASVFTRPNQYTGFINYSQINNSLNGYEPGLSTIWNALKYKAPGTGFIRSDALLVVVVVGNGEDTSGVTFCTRSDGYVGPCEDVGFPQSGTKTSSFNTYKANFLTLKTSSQLLKWYSAVSTAARTNCLGGRAYRGQRYIDMATALGGSTYDICTSSVSSVLGSLAASLQAQKLAFRQKYIFLSGEPNVDTIKVTKISGGSRTELTQNTTNGWSYRGQITDFAIDYPVPMNLTSGIALELHGSAKLVGDDTADVSFKPAGASNAAEK